MGSFIKSLNDQLSLKIIEARQSIVEKCKFRNSIEWGLLLREMNLGQTVSHKKHHLERVTATKEPILFQFFKANKKSGKN